MPPKRPGAGGGALTRSPASSTTPTSAAPAAAAARAIHLCLRRAPRRAEPEQLVQAGQALRDGLAGLRLGGRRLLRRVRCCAGFAVLAQCRHHAVPGFAALGRRGQLRRWAAGFGASRPARAAAAVQAAAAEGAAAVRVARPPDCPLDGLLVDVVVAVVAEARAVRRQVVLSWSTGRRSLLGSLRGLCLRGRPAPAGRAISAPGPGASHHHRGLEVPMRHRAATAAAAGAAIETSRK